MEGFQRPIAGRYSGGAPSLRTMVRMAVKCADAEELGERLRRRYISRSASACPSGIGAGSTEGHHA